MSGWEATDIALVILAVFAPAALLAIFALARGYNVKVRLWRDNQKTKPDQSVEE